MTQANPDVTAGLRADGVTAGLTPERLLFVGQQGDTATATSGVLTQNIGNDGEEDTLYDSDSPLAAAIRRARRRNPATQIDAIGLADNGAGVAATATVTFTGPATEDGTITVYVGSKKFNKYALTVTSADTATVIGDALEAAITGDANAFVTAVNVAGVVTLTAKSKGTFGNTIGIKIEGAVAGTTAVATAMSGGATDPVLTGVFDVVGNQRYQGIVWQFSADLSEVSDFLEDRFNVTNDILDGRAFVSATDAYANHLVTLAALNSKDICLHTGKLIARNDHRGPGVLEIPFVVASEFAAIRALRRTEKSSLGDLVISRSTLDSFGGPWQNSKPYFNTPLPDLMTPDLGDAFEDSEVTQLVAAGGWVIDANRANNTVIAGQVVTTYKTDVAGNPDPTFTFLNYVDTATAAREYLVNNTRAQYPQYRATGGALIPGVDSANEASVAAFVAEKYAKMGALALVVTGIGTVGGVTTDYDKAFRENLTVTLNPTTGKFLVGCKLYIVTQMRGVTYDLAIAFEV